MTTVLQALWIPFLIQSIARHRPYLRCLTARKGELNCCPVRVLGARFSLLSGIVTAPASLPARPLTVPSAQESLWLSLLRTQTAAFTTVSRTPH